MVQLSLVGVGPPRVDSAFRRLRRVPLSTGCWVDQVSGWLAGHEAVFDALRRDTRWRSARRQMYDRVVDVPRLMAKLPDDGAGLPVLDAMAAALTDRYGYPAWSVSLALYRDGRDSVAFHGDRMGKHRSDTVVAIVSVGEPRPFLLRPAGGGASRRFRVGWGDLVVMGGACQEWWEHSVPKVARAGPRIAIMFRPGRYPEV